MEHLIQKVRAYIQTERLIHPGSAVAAGVSGGADSVCLLLILHALQAQLDFHLYAVHVEHGLRGAASKEDAVFTQQLCRQLDVPCRIFCVDVAAQAKRLGIGTEEAGRQLRSEAFAAVKASLQEDGWSDVKIATAHHADDQAETVLLNLARGTGLKGMGGIRPEGNGRIHPLLTVRRTEIEQYLLETGQDWRTDETNLTDSYARNVVRHHVMRVLNEQINNQSSMHICEAAREAQRVQAYLERQCAAAMAGRVRQMQDVIEVPVDMLAMQDEVIRDMIWRKCIADLRGGLRLKDISRGHIRDLNRLAGMDCGRQLDLPGALQAVRIKDAVRLRKRDSTKAKELPFSYMLCPPADGSQVMIRTAQGTIRSRWVQPGQLPEQIPEMRYTKWLSCDIMSDAVCLRTRQTGDYLVLDQTGAKKKLKDYFIDRKIPADERDQILLAAQGHHILWVIGGRISAGAKIFPDTQRIMEISFTPRVERMQPCSGREDEDGRAYQRDDYAGRDKQTDR